MPNAFRMLANFILIPSTIIVLVTEGGYTLFQSGAYGLAFAQFLMTILVIAYWLAPAVGALKAYTKKLNSLLIFVTLIWCVYALLLQIFHFLAF